MPSTYSSLSYHLVWSTKNRAPLINGDLRPKLYEYLGGVVRAEGGTLTEVGGVEDHVHLLVKLKPTQAIADVLRVVKANSSKWVNEGALAAGRFEWQVGYSAFTVSQSQIETVRAYLQRQAEHHKRTTFREEIELLCQKHGVDFRPEYFE